MSKKKNSDDLKEASFNMKKFFKSPEDVSKVSFAEYQTKRLKKVLNKDLANAPFLFITNFKFEGGNEEEEKPMIFIGSVNGFWKKAINLDFKRRKEFAQGVCTLKEENGKSTLILDVKKGKGQRASNLKMINKILLKKLKISAEFAGKQVDENTENNDSQEIGEDVIAQTSTPFGRIKQEMARFKKMSEDDIEQRVRQIDLLYSLINEWEVTYKGHKKERKDEAKQIKKLKAFLKEASKKDNKGNLNIQLLDSFKDDLKSYLISRNEFISTAKELKQEGKIGDKLKELYSELQILKENIMDWRLANPKISKAEEKQLSPIDSRIKIEEKDLIKWLKQNNVDPKKLNEDKKATQAEKDARELMELANKTQLPEMKKPSRASSTFKKLYKAFEQYNTIAGDDIEMRKVKLLEITAYVNQWEKEWAAKSSLKKKLGNGKKEEVEVKKIKSSLKIFLSVITQFTLDRDNYLDIMNAHRDFQKLSLNYTPSEEMDDKATYLMDNIEYMIEEWQTHYTNISSFGTKKKNQKIESIREELVAFVKKQGENKQIDDTSAILTQLSQNKVDAINSELDTLKDNETQKFYADENNKKKLDEINTQRQDLETQKGKLSKKLSNDNEIARLTALAGVNHQLKSLDRQQIELESPIKTIVDAKSEELNTGLQDDKKSQIEKIVVAVASQLSESADNGEFSKELFDTRRELKKLNSLIKKHQGSNSSKVKATLKDAQEKATELEAKIPNLEDKAIQEAYPKISALAKHLAENLAKKHQLSNEQFQEILIKLDDHTTYLTNNMSEDMQSLCKSTAQGILDDPHFDLEDINANIKTKLTYDYDNDKELKTIGKDTASIEKIKATDQKDRSKKLKSWYKKSTIWETKIGDYYPSPLLDKGIADLESYKDRIRPIKEMVKHIDELSDIEKQIKVLSENQKMLKKQVAGYQKKLLSAKPEKKAAIIDAINKKQNAVIETTLKLKGLAGEWDKHYKQINDPAFSKKKIDTQTKIHKLEENFDGQLGELNSPDKINKKHELALQIQTKYEETNFQFDPADREALAEGKQKNVSEILAKIVDWESISVVLLADKEIEEQGADAKMIKTIQSALLQEKYRFDNKIKIYKDPVFDTITKQVAKLKLDTIVTGKKVNGTKVNNDVIKQLFGLEKIITVWKDAHPTTDANYIEQHTTIKGIEEQIQAIKISPVGGRSIEQQDFILRVNDLEKRYKKYSSIDALVIDDESLTKLKEILQTGVKDAKEMLFLPKNAHSRLDKVETKFAEFEKEMLQKIHDEKQKEEAEILSLLEGCDSYDKIKDILSEQEQLKINIAKDRAIKRAELILASGGSSDEAERMLEHIPIAFWPDDFLEEMRLWRKAEKLYFEQKGQEAEKEFIDSGLKEFIANAKEAITEPMKAYSAILGSGKYSIDRTNPDGTTTKVELNLLDSSHEKETNPDGTPMKGSTIAKNVVGSAIDATKAIADIKKLIDSRKDDDPEAIRKRQIMIGRVVASTTQKLCNNATKYINTSAEGIGAPKIATAVLKSVSLLTSLILKSTDGLEDPVLAKEHFKEVFSVENASEIIDTLLNVGAGISEIVSLFNSMGNIVGAAFGVAVNVKELIASAQKLHAAVQAKNEMRSVQDRAVKQDSVMLHAIRREMRTAKEDVTKEAINVTGDSLRVVGSGTATVGAIVGLGQPAVGAGLNVGGKVVEKLGDAIKIGGKVAFMIRDNETKKKVKKLIIEAKTDRNARIELLENSKFFAKAFLAIGLENDDAIARHYCLVKGLTEDDLNHEATARSILEKLIADDPSTLDEETIGDKVQNLGKSISKISNKYGRLDHASIAFNNAKELRPSVINIIDTYKKLDKAATGTEIASIVTMGFAGLNLLTSITDDVLRSYLEDCAKHFKDLYDFLVIQESNHDLHIEKLIEEIEAINGEIESSDTDSMLEKINEIASKEDKVSTHKFYIQEAKQCEILFNAIGVQ